MRRCEFCDEPLERRRYASGMEGHRMFAARKYCNQVCAKRARRQPFETYVAMTPSGCWTWTGARSDTGYGTYTPYQEPSQLAHRMTYEMVNGTIIDDRVIDHLCRNRLCVNPDHLELVVEPANIRRGDRAKLTHAKAAALRRRRETGESLVSLGVAFGIDPSHASRVARGLAWT